MDTTQALLLHNHVPKYLWGKAVLTTVHLLNRVPVKNISYFSPLDLLLKHYRDIPLKTGLKPKVFRCIAYVHVLGPGLDKFARRAIKCAILCYCDRLISMMENDDYL